jgi:hypothetical protein
VEVYIDGAAESEAGSYLCENAFHRRGGRPWVPVVGLKPPVGVILEFEFPKKGTEQTDAEILQSLNSERWAQAKISWVERDSHPHPEDPDEP